MLIDFETSFYTVMVVSIIAVFWLEALTPLERVKLDIEHVSRNFLIWLLAFFCADFLVGYYMIDFQSLIYQQSFGVFYWFSLPSDWMLIIIGVLLVDLTDYLFHRYSHHNRFLWRLHAMHHSDTLVDVSTTLRAHPLDLIVGNFWRIGFALIFGIPIWVVAFREVFIFPLTFLQHGNVRFSPKLEGIVRKVFITPEIHRLHHSIKRDEHDSNYGDSLIFWDRMFGSYRQPESSKPEKYGVKHLEGESHQTLDGMLLTPFRVYKRR